VLANGGIGGILVFMNFLFPDERYCIAYLGAVAAATADTWRTEIGIRLGVKPFKWTEPGRLSQLHSSVPGMLGNLLRCLSVA